MEAPYKLFTSIEQIKTVDTKRVLYVLALIFSFITTEIGRYVYRPFIYQNGINDFGLADSMGNTGGIIVQVFFGMALLNPDLKQGFRVILFLVTGFILYEFMQTFLPKGTFDIKDVVGTVLGGIVSAATFFVIQRYFKNNRTLVKL